MTVQWEKVYVFISSTFNDMHAERDYLVKQVFPRLQEWCERRKLRLVDIDLRWGVTEADASQNKRVVQVCLERIDACRPFFLCFIGQRRGWTPDRDDISAETFENYPDLERFAGDASVTELEILHAYMNPLHRGKAGAEYARAEHSFFYLRQPEYLAALPPDPPQLRAVYTNEGSADSARDDAQLRRWREVEIPRTGRPVHTYTAHWNAAASTPEIRLPLECPSTAERDSPAWQAVFTRWARQWAQAGVRVDADGSIGDPDERGKAEAYNVRLTKGRLGGFTYNGQALADVIIVDLQTAINARYPDHVETADLKPLQRELDQQARFLEAAGEGFIERAGDFTALDRYIENESACPLFLTAPGGLGKTSLLARWIDRTQLDLQESKSLHYRFIGGSDGSSTVDALLHSLLGEIKEVAGKLPDIEIPAEPDKLRAALPKLLEAAGKRGKTVLVMDGLNQLETGLSDLSWLPLALPVGVKLVASFKRGEEQAEAYFGKLKAGGQAILAEVRPFASLEDRRKLLRAYLSQFLKELDERHLESLIRSEGASNPLYLKVVLAELRVFGAFGDLGAKIRGDFGSTPVSAFHAVLRRLETDPAHAPVEPAQAVPLLFGLLAHARQGLSVEELSQVFGQVLGRDTRAAAETIQLYLRQVRPFVGRRDGRAYYFFDSFLKAARERYTTQPAGMVQGARSTQAWHALLADYFQAVPLWAEAISQPPSRRKVMELPYHLAGAGRGPAFVKTLTDFEFLQAKLSVAPPASLIDDYALSCTGVRAEQQAGLDQLRAFLRQCAHALRADPAQLPGQLLGRLGGDAPAPIRALLQQAQAWRRQPWLRPKQPSLRAAQASMVKTLPGHTALVQAAVLSVDGRIAVSGSFNRELIVWDVERGEAICTLEGHAKGICWLNLLPGDSQLLSMDRDGEVRLWDLHSRQATAILQPAWGMGQVHADADGRTAVVASGGTISRIELPSGRVLTSHQYSGLEKEVAVAPLAGVAIFRQDKQWLRWSYRQDQVTRLHTGIELINALAASLDGRIVAEAGYGIMRIRDTASGAVLSSFPLTRRQADMEVNVLVKTLCFYDDKVVAAGCEDKTVRLYRIDTGLELQVLRGHAGEVRALGASHQAGLVLSGSEDRSLRVWRVDAPQQDRVLAGHTERVNDLATSAQGEWAVSASDDFTLNIWSLATGEEVASLQGHSEERQEVRAVAVGVDGTTIVSGAFKTGMPGESTLMKVWHWPGGKLVRRIASNSSIVTRIVCLPDGARAVTTGDGGLRVWNLHTGTCLHTLRGPDSMLDVWADGRIAVSADYHTEGGSSLLKVWDLLMGREIASLTSPQKAMRSVVLVGDGRHAATASQDGKLLVWDLFARTSSTVLEEGAELLSMAVLPDQSHLLAGGEGGRVWMVDTASLGHRLLVTVPGGAVYRIAILAQGGLAVLCGMDEALRVVDLASGRVEASLSLDAHITALSTMDDDVLIVAADNLGRVHVLELVGLGAPPSAAERAAVKAPAAARTPPRPAPRSPGPPPAAQEEKKPSRGIALNQRAAALAIGLSAKMGKEAVRDLAAQVESELDRYDVQLLVNILGPTVARNKKLLEGGAGVTGSVAVHLQLAEGNEELEAFVNRLRARLRRVK
jgi:WD40 repeat protein